MCYCVIYLELTKTSGFYKSYVSCCFTANYTLMFFPCFLQ